MHRIRQVDVFGSGPLTGNPVAVVHDADDLDSDQMQRLARWTNLSETTFLLAPSSESADYRLRIFTPTRELPFAGHPTLGSAHAWLEAGGRPHVEDLVQECDAGRVPIRRGKQLGFRAPPLLRTGAVDAEELDALVRILRVDRAKVVDAQWVDNGPGWVALLLADAQDVLDLRPDRAALGERDIGVAGPWRPDADGHPGGVDVEIRAFMSEGGEDPVTGSLNASLGQWLAGTVLPSAYVAAQGTVIGRAGRVHVTKDTDGEVWVAGATTTVVHGEVHL